MLIIEESAEKSDNNLVKAMKKILLIEDDTNFVYIMKTIVETKDRKLFAVSNVENAINILRKNNNIIDLILTDYNLRCNKTCMPIFDYLRDFNLDIPVIVLSANEYEDYADIVKNAGALACYDKTSLSISKIRKIISGILK